MRVEHRGRRRGLARWDETRVFYTQLEKVGAIEDANDKKQAAYFVAMTYAAQNIVDKAVQKYDAFVSDYRSGTAGVALLPS